MSDKINFSYWRLDLKKGTEVVGYGFTFDVHETANFLSEAIGTKISERNVLELSLMPFENNFGSYNLR